MPTPSQQLQLFTQLGEFVGNVAIVCHDPDDDGGLAAEIWATDMLTGLRKVTATRMPCTLAEFRRLYAAVVRECLKALEERNG